MANLEVSSFIDTFMQAADRAAAASTLFTAGTLTSDQKVIDASATWNNAGVTFTALKLNVTDSASAAASLLADLQVGGTSKFKVSKSGGLVSGDGAASAPAWMTTSSATNNIGLFGTAQNLVVSMYGNEQFTFGHSSNGSSFYAQSGAEIGWVNGPNPVSGTPDTKLVRDGGAGILAQRNGANAQAYRLYNTYTDASNYERGVIGWSANTLTIGTEKAGTGSARALELQTDGTTRVTIAANGVATFTGNILAPNGLRVGTTTAAFGALLDTNSGLLLKSTVPMAFSSATDNNGDLRSTIDGGISRLGPASLAVGNGTVGDTSGTMTASGQRIVPATAPAAPATGWTIFCDSGDGNKLKAIYSTGTVATIATP